MIIIDSALKKRQSESNPIKVGITGHGEMGKGIINQIYKHTHGVKIVLLFTRNIENAVNSLKSIGIDNYVITNNPTQAEGDIMNGKIVIMEDEDAFCSVSNMDVLVEATGAIEFAARIILKAFSNGKHVLSFNAELDSFLGPIILRKSKEYGVKYALGDGDQPGVTMNLYRYIKSIGFEPLVCGNIKGMQDHYRTPETQKGFASSWGMNPVMATNFADGTKVSFEQSCIANATGMKVAQRGMLGYEAHDHIDNLTHLFDVEMLREMGGIVEYIIGAKPSPGVFVYASASDPLSVKYLKYGKLGDGPLYSFYVPYHLLFFDIASSICRLIDFDDPVIIASNGPMVDVITVAKTDLYPGDIIDGIGGFKAFGICENYPVVVKENLLPMGLSEGCIVKKPIKKDDVVSLSDIQLPAERLIDTLRNQQNSIFGS